MKVQSSQWTAWTSWPVTCDLWPLPSITWSVWTGDITTPVMARSGITSTSPVHSFTSCRSDQTGKPQHRRAGSVSAEFTPKCHSSAKRFFFWGIKVSSQNLWVISPSFWSCMTFTANTHRFLGTIPHNNDLFSDDPQTLRSTTRSHDNPCYHELTVDIYTTRGWPLTSHLNLHTEYSCRSRR